MSVFDTDLNVVSKQNVAVRRRTPAHLAWLRDLISPIVYLQGLFNAFRRDTLYYLSHNSQVCYMEAVLNDTFDNTLRRIYITDGAYCDAVYIFQDDEDEPVYIDLDSEIGDDVIDDPDPVPLYTDAECYVEGVQFVVMVPTAVAGSPGFDLNRCKAVVNKYRMAGKSNYTVVYF